MTNIVGSGGGGKGGGGGRVAVEAPNTLESIQKAQIIDLISEGPIMGLVSGPRSIFLDGVPLQNSDGSNNFSGYSYEVRVGTQTQTPVTGALEGVKRTLVNPNSGIEIKKNIPQEVTISDSRVESVDVTLGLPQLTFQDPKTGDLNGSRVDYSIHVKAGGGNFTLVRTSYMQGKCTSLFQRSYKVDLTGLTFPVTIRVTRITEDSTKVNVQNKLYWYSYTEHIPAKLSYPNSALVYFDIDSQQFARIPTRGYEIYGLRIKVPSNYNPETRQYTGSWDGTFKLSWTNNPAWVYYDLVTNTRYGLGNILDQSQINKWELYTIAKYCDELVPTGIGAGMEPRFSCNTYIQSAEEAYNLLNAIASIFRGMQYWASSQITVSADMPRDPVAQFTSANVIDGVFNYSGTSAKTRRTVAQVTWNDPLDMYRQKVEYVEDPEGVQRYGVITAEVLAVGCTSRGQAHRVGRWLLYSEQMETETVTFSTSIEAAVVMPGDVIQTQDPFRAGSRYGGRIVDVLSPYEVVLDNIEVQGPLVLSTFEPYYDTVSKTNKAKLISRPGTVSNNVFTSTFTYTTLPEKEGIWVASVPGVLEPEQWRVISVSEGENLSVIITALEYRKDKFAAVERDLVLEERPTSLIDYSQPEAPYIPVENESTWYQEYLYFSGPGVLNNGATFSWSSSATTFIFRYQNPSGVWKQETLKEPTIDLKPLPIGLYNIEVIAVNNLGYKSLPLTAKVNILGKMAPPGAVDNFVCAKSSNGLNLTWNANSDLDLKGYEVRELYALPAGASVSANGQVVWGVNTTSSVKNQVWDAAFKKNSGTIYETSYLDPESPLGYNVYLIKAIDTSGNYSTVPSICGVEVSAPKAIISHTWTLDGDQIVIQWSPPTSDLGIKGYKLSYDAQTVTLDKAEFRSKVWWSGATEYFEIRAYDSGGNLSPIYNVEITFQSLGTPTSVTTAIEGSSFRLNWRPPTSASVLPVETYELRTNLTWGTKDSGFLVNTASTTYTAEVDWGGNKRFYLAARDTAGVYGSYYTIDLNIVPPGEPQNFRQTVVDNNVLLYWNDPPTGTLPVEEYEVRKGSSWDAATVIGTKSGKFTTILETVSGDYTYWIAAKNSAGIYGTPTSTTAKVNQPPDYVLQNDYYSTYTGTKSNARPDNGSLLIPVNTTETWEGHFTSRGWSTPQDQINAGFSRFIQPTPTSGYYEEIINYTPAAGITIPASTVTVTPTSTIIVGTPTVSCQLSYSADGVTWVGPVTGYSLFISNYKYVKVRLTVSNGLVNFSNLNIRLDTKLKNFMGNVECNAADSGGTIVYLTEDKASTGAKVFLDVESITLTPKVISGVVPVAIYDFVDTIHPLSFKILLLNSQTGARLSGTCSYSIRGY